MEGQNFPKTEGKHRFEPLYSPDQLFSSMKKAMKGKGYKKAAEVHGVDISENEIELAKQHYKGIDFRVASVAALPYKNSYFDLVLIALAFTHFDNMDKALAEACRVLKTGGRLVIS